MKAFTFVRPTTLEEAAKAAAEKGAVLKAGGIDLLDRMKERVDEPERVVALAETANSNTIIGRVHEGAARDVGWLSVPSVATLADITNSRPVADLCPALTEAAGLAASPQIRARATIGGNVLQHTRCGYYRHASFPCLKRGDASCPVLDAGAVQDAAAIFGNGACASAHPSSLAPVLAACGARYMLVSGPKERVAWDVGRQLFAQPQRGRRSDATLRASDVIDCFDIPVVVGRRAVYEEIRQKAAFDWALVSCCVRLDMDGDKVRDAGVWLGSVAPTPWHAEAAEKALAGKSPTDETIRAAAEAATAGASPLPGNAYKVELVKVVVRRALERLRSAK